MASVVGICNLALVKIGANTIESLTENLKEARYCNALYAHLRDDVLRAHHWNFAASRVQLAESTTAPVFKYDYSYTLPADCLKARWINEEPETPVDWEIEARTLVTNENPVYLSYTRQETDPNLFDPLFIEVLACRLAAELAFPIMKSTSLAQLQRQIYEATLGKAATIDSTEGNQDPEDFNPYVESRS